MVGWNQSQKGFMERLATVVALLLGGWGLTMLADNRIADMETAAEMNTYSWLNMLSGLLFAASMVAVIVTLRYGRRHEAAIREHKSISRLLTAYRLLFWLSFVASLLGAAILLWFVLHLGPVR